MSALLYALLDALPCALLGRASSRVIKSWTIALLVKNCSKNINKKTFVEQSVALIVVLYLY